MPRLRFKVHYKNGMIGVEASEGDELTVTDAQLKHIREDLRNPDDALDVLDAPKRGAAKRAASDEG
jgi:hypothetical protein